MDNRVSWDEYFMNVARVVATRATCECTSERSWCATRPSCPPGTTSGLPHCTEAGHMMEDGHCVATVHAEANAIIQAAKNGVAIEGRASTRPPPPCWPCFKLIANAGCRRIVFGEFYRDGGSSSTPAARHRARRAKVPAKPDVQPADTGHARTSPRARAAAPAGGRGAVAAAGGTTAGVSVLRSSSPTTAATAARRATRSCSRWRSRAHASARSAGSGSGNAASLRADLRERAIDRDDADRRPPPGSLRRSISTVSFSVQRGKKSAPATSTRVTPRP